MLRWRTQQLDVDELGADTNQRFAGFSPLLKELLADASFRDADLIFDDAVRLDLGGVHVRVFGVGPTHTRGDTVFFVEEDRVLYAGDVVMPVFPAVNAATSSVAQWLRDMDAFERLSPTVVVPAHGRTGGPEFIQRFRAYLTAVQTRVTAAKRAGDTLDKVTGTLSAQLANEFPELAPTNGAPTGRINAAIQAAFREAPAP